MPRTRHFPVIGMIYHILISVTTCTSNSDHIEGKEPPLRVFLDLRPGGGKQPKAGPENAGRPKTGFLPPT
jgi:hypothetical protein